MDGLLCTRYECGGNTRHEYQGTCTGKEQYFGMYMYYVYPGAKGRRMIVTCIYHEGVKHVLLYTYQGLSLSIDSNALKEFEGTRTTSEVIK